MKSIEKSRNSNINMSHSTDQYSSYFSSKPHPMKKGLMNMRLIHLGSELHNAHNYNQQLGRDQDYRKKLVKRG